MLTQNHREIQKNAVLLNENVKQNNRKTKQKRKRFTNAYIDEFLGNISSTNNDSDDSDGERSDSKIDMLIE